MAKTFENFPTSEMTDLHRRPGANAAKVTKIVFNEETVTDPDVPTVTITLGGTDKVFDLWDNTFYNKVERFVNSQESLAELVKEEIKGGGIKAQ